MSNTSEIPAVARTSPEYDEMVPGWDLVDALNGGTTAMRAAAEKYLPKMPQEESSDYDERLKTATLFPAFTETVESMTGRVFTKPPVVEDSVQEWIRNDVLEDFDLEGRSFNEYLNEWFSKCLRKGIGYTLIDAPPVAAMTQEEQKKLGARPYGVEIDARAVLGWKMEKGKLVQARIKFCEEEPDPNNEFRNRVVNRIRVYEETRIRTYRQNEKGEWPLESERTNSFGFIALVCLNLKRKSFMVAEPPLKELAHLNVKHWQQQSLSDTLLAVASVPILAISGVDEKDEIKVGAKHAVTLPKDASMEFVEHGGKAIECGAKQQLELKDEMRQAGAKLLVPNTEAAKTATESREDSSRENSKLGKMVALLTVAAKEILDMCAKTRSKDDAGGGVKFQPNLDPDTQPVESMKVLTEMGKLNIISDQTIFEEAKRRALLSDTCDWETEQQRIKDSSLGMGMGTLPKLGADPADPDADPNADPAAKGKPPKAPAKPAPAAPPKA